MVEHAAALAADPEPVFRGRAGRILEVLGEPLADELTRRDALMFPALLHDMAKPATHAITPEGRVTFIGHDRLGAEKAADLMRRLHTSARLREFTTDCVRWHLPLGFMVHRTPLSLRQIDRYLRRTAPVGGGDHPPRRAPDRLATRGKGSEVGDPPPPGAGARGDGRVLHAARSRAGAPLLPGDEIARELGREPGPWLAEVVDALREGQVVGVIRTEDQARRFVRSYFG